MPATGLGPDDVGAVGVGDERRTGEASSWFAVRVIAYLKFCAVTGLPSLNLKPFRIVNVYRFPLLETVKFEATSGTSFDPGGPGLSG